MEDLNSTLSSILGDPQKLEQLRQVAQSLGIDTGAPAQPTGLFNQQPGQQLNQQQPQEYSQQAQQFNPQQPAQPTQQFQQFQQQPQQFSQQPQEYSQQTQQFNQQPAQQTFQQQAAPPQSGAPAGGFNPAAFAGIAEVMKTFNQSDKNVELLQTLKPHFSPARAGKIDDAVRIMQIIRAWPALRDSGMLGSLGNMFGGGAK